MDYQGNSKNKGAKAKLDPSVKKDELKKVVTGDVVVKKEGVSSKFKRVFLGGDFHTAADYVLSEVLLPALRNLLADTVSKGADRLIYGDSARKRGPTNYAPRTQYHNPLIRQDPRYLPNQPPVQRWTGNQKTFHNIIVSTKEDADGVVEAMIDIVDKYEVVSIADLNEILGLPSTEGSHVDNKWGWTNLRSIEVRQVREGHEISFPPLEEIE